MEKKKDHLLTECRKLVLQAVWWNDSKLISRHVEFQVRTQLVVGEFRQEFKSEVTAKDEYLGAIMKAMVKFWKIIQFIREGELRKRYRGPSSEPYLFIF